MPWLFIIITASVAVSIAIWVKLSGNRGIKGPPWLHAVTPRRVLLVTAHPDDECMFFSPTLTSLQRLGHTVFVMCLSTGDYYKQGPVRVKELYASCNQLGVPQQQVFIVNDSVLQDDPTVRWNRETVARYISEKVEEISADIVLTFDSYGVSGHLNHQAIHEAVSYLMSHSSGQFSSKVLAYRLTSESLLHKYISFCDVTYTWYTGDMVFIADWVDFRRGQEAMMTHWSQFVWFRVLYIIFSRYMIINSFEPITGIPS